MQTLDLTRIGREGMSAPDLHIQVPFLDDGSKNQKSRELVFLSLTVKIYPTPDITLAR